MKIAAAQFDIFYERAFALTKKIQNTETDYAMFLSDHMPKNPPRIEVLVTWRTKNKFRKKYLPFMYWLLPGASAKKIERAFYHPNHKVIAGGFDVDSVHHVAVFVHGDLVAFESCGHHRLWTISSRLPEVDWELLDPDRLKEGISIAERKAQTSR